ncbi:hypothetical protein [Chryseobacterium sp. KMC2]|uniref:hypothetical protein n=1 Tax=Chryseobacterium sp. KMC2 TaxID=2800705 RepID=UPI0019237847|nr:hypothetical protein [Chryseobacterium sp. KMC2]MBL3550530.1 hypothetical protein [Chryseobacterium sp. KMC2]
MQWLLFQFENNYIYQYKDDLGNTRVSFAKNSAGALEITDTNNYYSSCAKSFALRSLEPAPSYAKSPDFEQ